MAFEEIDLIVIARSIREAREAADTDEKIDKALDALDGIVKYLQDGHRGNRDLMGLTARNFTTAIR